MRVSWRNLEWLSEHEQAEIQRMLETLTRGAVGLDRVDLVGPGEAAPFEARVLAKVGKSQITVVRKESSRERALVAVLTAFEESARWLLDSIAATPQAAPRGGVASAGPRAATSDTGKGKGTGRKRRSPSRRPLLPQLRLLEVWSSWTLKRGSAEAQSAAPAPAKRKARPIERSRSSSTPRRGARRRGTPRKRLLPAAAAMAGFMVFGLSAFEVPTLIFERPASAQAAREVPLAFSATAGATLRPSDGGVDFSAVATASLPAPTRKRSIERVSLAARATRVERSDDADEIAFSDIARADDSRSSLRGLVAFSARAR